MDSDILVRELRSMLNDRGYVHWVNVREDGFLVVDMVDGSEFEVCVRQVALTDVFSVEGGEES